MVGINDLIRALTKLTTIKSLPSSLMRRKGFKEQNLAFKFFFLCHRIEIITAKDEIAFQANSLDISHKNPMEYFTKATKITIIGFLSE